MSKIHNLIIGIDEVGRGPIAGPITLCAFAAPQSFKIKLIKILGGRIKDSKQLSSKRREEIYKELKKLQHTNRDNKDAPCCFFVSHVSNTIIDKKGISYATKLGIKRCLNKLPLPALPLQRGGKTTATGLKVVLDGSLKAPAKYKNQKTIIGGDSKDIFIACASIVAKVRRDRLMCRLGRQEPRYAFEIHKGYGTALHYKLLAEHGLSDLHRKSFIS